MWNILVDIFLFLNIFYLINMMYFEINKVGCGAGGWNRETVASSIFRLIFGVQSRVHIYCTPILSDKKQAKTSNFVSTISNNTTTTVCEKSKHLATNKCFFAISFDLYRSLLSLHANSCNLRFWISPLISLKVYPQS